MSPRRITLIDEPALDLVNAVNSLLRLYNQTENHVWWDAMHDPANEARPVSIFAFDDTDQLIGGLSGETCLSRLRVHIMAVQEDHRSQGIGSQMLELAEGEAIGRGCKYAFLDTMQYQAPDFYTRCGYEVAGMIEDWDSHGNAKYFMTKTLAISSPRPM